MFSKSFIDNLGPVSRSLRVRMGVTFYTWTRGAPIRWTIYRALCTFSVEKSTLIMAWDKFFFWSNQAAAGQVRKSITSNNVSAPGLLGTSAGRLMSSGTYCGRQGNTRLANSTPHHLLSCFQCLQPHQHHHQHHHHQHHQQQH